MNDITILLTGGTGYLGSNILKKLVDSGNKVILLKRSFSGLNRIDTYKDKIITYDIDVVPLEKVFSDNKIDYVLHCATNYGRRQSDPINIIEANLLLPLKLLDLAKKYKARGFINTDTILDKRVNSYSLSKKQFKDWLYAYRSELICVNVPIEHFYGPGDDDTKFVTYIVRNLLKRVDKIDLTKGEQKRDFVYVDDTVEAFMKIITSAGSLPKGFHEFEVGSSSSISIKAFVELTKELAGNDSTVLNFGAVPYRENEVMSCNADTTALANLGWSARVPLSEGLKKTIEAEKALLAKKVD